MVGIQTFPADGNKVAISQERQYAKVWTREDCHLWHKMSKPRLLIIVSFYWLSTRLDVQTVNLATSSLPTHACFTVLLLFDCKISSAIIGGFVHMHCTASPHAFRMASLYGHHTNAHVTGCQQWHYQKLPLLITAFIAVWLSHWGLRQWPCNAILPTHATFTNNQLFYNFSSDIQETVLVHSGILNVADRSATSNMPQCPAARTRHICHADKSARFVRCATVSSYLIYVTIYL